MILLGGTVGYMFLEGYHVTDALYLTIITVATVGYGDMVPITSGGKILTVVLVLVGVSFVMYMFGKIVEAMVEGGLREILVTEKARLNGKTLIESNLRQNYNIIVIGIKLAGENMQFNPKPDMTIRFGDILIVLGLNDQIATLEKEMLG